MKYNVTKDEIQQHFHLPLEEAAKALGICASVLKRSCRQHGIKRWPYRKIKSLNKRRCMLQNGSKSMYEQFKKMKEELDMINQERKGILELIGAGGSVGDDDETDAIDIDEKELYESHSEDGAEQHYDDDNDDAGDNGESVTRRSSGASASSSSTPPSSSPHHRLPPHVLPTTSVAKPLKQQPQESALDRPVVAHVQQQQPQHYPPMPHESFEQMAHKTSPTSIHSIFGSTNTGTNRVSPHGPNHNNNHHSMGLNPYDNTNRHMLRKGVNDAIPSISDLFASVDQGAPSPSVNNSHAAATAASYHVPSATSQTAQSVNGSVHPHYHQRQQQQLHPSAVAPDQSMMSPSYSDPLMTNHPLLGLLQQSCSQLFATNHEGRFIWMSDSLKRNNTCIFGDVENLGRILHRDNVRFTERSRRIFAAIVARPFRKVDLDIIVPRKDGVVFAMQVHSVRLDSTAPNSRTDPMTAAGHFWYVDSVSVHHQTPPHLLAPSRYIELDHYTEYEMTRVNPHFRSLQEFETESVNIYITNIGQ